jgi:hypothetical protein
MMCITAVKRLAACYECGFVHLIARLLYNARPLNASTS